MESKLPEELEEMAKNTGGKDAPLLKNTPAGMAIIGVPIASALAFAGWAGQKMLLLDEQQVQQKQVIEQIAARQEKHEAQIIAGAERDSSIEHRMTASEQELEGRGGRFEKVVMDLITMTERIARLEAGAGLTAAQAEAISKADERAWEMIQRVSGSETSIEWLRERMKEETDAPQP